MCEEIEKIQSRMLGRKRNRYLNKRLFCPERKKAGVSEISVYQKYNFAHCFIWVLNLVAHIEGET